MGSLGPARKPVDPVPRYRFHAVPMRTHEVADRAGVNAQTLRYYERRGLLSPPPRSPAGYRDYPPTVVGVLRFVKQSQQLGFTLTEVEELLALAAGGPDNCDSARTLAETHLRELDGKITELRRMRTALRDLVDTCDRPQADRSCPLLETIESETAQ